MNDRLLGEIAKYKVRWILLKMCIRDSCNIDVDCVNVKATTEECLGFTGRGEGISAHAVCLLV